MSGRLGCIGSEGEDVRGDEYEYDYDYVHDYAHAHDYGNENGRAHCGWGEGRVAGDS
jgi:hypothetical protein